MYVRGAARYEVLVKKEKESEISTLHRAPVGLGPSGPDWLGPLPLGFGLDGRLLLARHGRVYV